MRVTIVGGSGYVGGELLRLLLQHPHVELAQVTSERNNGQFVHSTHPNLRGWTELRYCSVAAVEPCDVLFLALPHGRAAERIEHWSSLAQRIIDCSADFRLRDPELYQRWYGDAHPQPEWVERFVYGLPEINRTALASADYVSGVGCNATAVNLALLPLIQHDLLKLELPIIADVKVGSSEGGAGGSAASHHPERSGVVRSFAPTGHRHTAEVQQVHSLNNVHLSITAVELVRGALATCHAWVRDGVTERDLWRAYRSTTSEHPFLRIVHERSGFHRHPEPKLVAGTNFADLGWSLDVQTGRIVALCALDNLMKGAAGSAVQALNLMCGWDERTGLNQIGLHPN